MRFKSLGLTYPCMLLAALAAVPVSLAQSTTFTYQGVLRSAGQPVNGSADLEFNLWDASSNGNLVAGPVSQYGTAVDNGLFSVPLDFGAVFTGQPLWLEISVNGTPLAPRQELTATPYSLFSAAPWASNNGVLTYLGGPVGIGTSDPQFALDVRTASVFGARFGMQDAGGGALALVCNPNDNRVYIEGYNSTNDGSADELLLTGYAGGEVPQLTLRATTTVAEGNVGIGVTNPVSRLEIAGQDALTITGYQPVLTMRDSNAGNARVRIQAVDGDHINFFTENALATGIPPMKIRNDGVDIAGQNALVMAGYQPFLTLSDSNAGYARSRIQGANGGIVFYTEASLATGVPPLVVQNTGITSVRVLQILGGADLAEPFEVNRTASDAAPSGENTQIEPGMVVVIDPAKPGALKLSTQAYDRKVAGVISGAGGVTPGLVMGQEGTAANGSHPVALTGRVYVWCDASAGAIEPGDSLTTSNVPGHAMKVLDREHAQGAILGKAMSALAVGERGLVLVLVNLH